MRRFVILAQDTTEEQNRNFISHLGANNMTWWHWIPTSWLIVDFSATQTAKTMREMFGTFFPGVRMLVIDVTDAQSGLWSGVGPASENDSKQNMFNWIRDTWDLR